MDSKQVCTLGFESCLCCFDIFLRWGLGNDEKEEDGGGGDGDGDGDDDDDDTVAIKWRCSFGRISTASRIFNTPKSKEPPPPPPQQQQQQQKQKPANTEAAQKKNRHLLGDFVVFLRDERLKQWSLSSWWFQPIWKILKNIRYISQIGSFLQVGVKIKHTPPSCESVLGIT